MKCVIKQIPELSPNQAGSIPDWPGSLGSVEMLADLVLDSATAGQLVAVGDGNYDGWFEEKGIPSLGEENRKHILQILIFTKNETTSSAPN